MRHLTHKMTVLASLDCLRGYPVGGVPRYVTQLVPRLRRQDNIELCTFSSGPLSARPELAIPPPNHVQLSVNKLLWRFVLMSCPDLASALFQLPAHEVLWIPTPTTLAPPCKAKARVVTVHDVGPVARPDLFRRTVSLRWRKYLRSQLKCASLVVVPSQFTASELVQHCGYPSHRIRIIPYGVTPTAVATPPPDCGSIGRHSFHALYIGQVGRKKNSKVLLTAFLLLLNELQDAHLTIVGEVDDDPSKDLARMLQSPPLRDHVTLLSKLTDDDLGRLYAACTAVICPSAYEGFGLPVLEALCYGKIVIASAIPAFKEIGRNFLRYFKVDSPEDLAHCMVTTAGEGDPSSSDAISRSEYASRFTWDHTADEHARIFLEAAATSVFP